MVIFYGGKESKTKRGGGGGEKEEEKLDWPIPTKNALRIGCASFFPFWRGPST